MIESFQHKKSLGQNFLNSDYVPKQMCDAAGLPQHEEEEGVLDSESSDYAGEGLARAGKERTNRSQHTFQSLVLEIGPGTGALTREILARGCRVIALEADPRAIAALEETFADEITRGQLTLHHHDARTLDPAAFGLTDHSYIVVSNIPYYLSGSLFRSFLDTECQPSDLVFLVQKEVAERIARDPKESLLSLSVKAFGSPRYVTTIKRTHFSPPPKVDSAIVAVTRINRSAFATLSSGDFFDHLHIGFGQKRKQLLGNLTIRYDRTELERVFTTIDIPLNTRAEDVGLEEWLRLVAVLSQSTN